MAWYVLTKVVLDSNIKFDKQVNFLVGIYAVSVSIASYMVKI